MNQRSVMLLFERLAIAALAAAFLAGALVGVWLF